MSWPGLYAFLGYFGSNVRIVIDVNRELEGHVKGDFPGINMMKSTPERNEFLEVRAEVLPPALALQVGPIAASFPDADVGGRFKNHGEVATVLMAKTHGAAVILDDFNGREFANLKQVAPVFSTRDIVVAMVADGALTEEQGLEVWAKVYAHEATARFFSRALAQFRVAYRQG